MHVKVLLPGGDDHLDLQADLSKAEFFAQVLGPMLAGIDENADQPIVKVELPDIRTPLSIRAHTTDVGAFRQIYFHEEYDIPLDLTSPKFIIDGGANVGYTSVYLANRFPEARIVSVEPESSNFAVLQANTAYYPNIQLIKGAIWNEARDLRIANSPPRHADYGSNKWGFMVDAPNEGLFNRLRGRRRTRVEDEPGDQGERLTAVTIGDILRNSGFDRIDVLKLDIEGAEKEVFSSNYADWIEKVDTLLIELHDNQKKGCSKALYSAVAGRRYRESHQGDVVILRFDS